MCLSNFNEPRGKIASTNLKNRIAYKMMEGLNSEAIQKRKRLFNYWRTSTFLYIDGRWNVDKKKGMIDEYEPYPTGYHAYLREDDAKGCYIFCKVEFDDVVATGYQNKAPVVVARKVRVLEVWKYEYPKGRGYGKWKCVRKNDIKNGGG